MRKKYSRAVAFAMAGLLTVSTTTLSFGTSIFAADNAETLQTIAFPGAEGGGMYASGGRGYSVYTVTNLEDYALDETPIEGSLRYGIDNAGDGTIVVFNVGGTIHLKRTLTFRDKKNITLAGQTAPGDGITLAGYDTNISNSENLIIRFLRFRPGAENVYSGGDSMDALWGRDNDTFIIDHCSFSWNTDETLSTYRGKNGTVQWCIISESLTCSGHTKGRHGYGGIFGGDNTVFQYNLIANHTSRAPRIGGGSMGDPTKDGGSMATLQISNNVVYNWGYLPCYGGGFTNTNYMNNYLKAGLGTRDDVDGRIIQFGEKNKLGTFYVAGNVVEGNAALTADNNRGVVNAGQTTGTMTTTQVTSPLEADAFNQITLTTAEDCYAKVLGSAGATFPERDAIDARTVAETVNNTGFFINTEDEVGGYSTDYSARAEGFDTDGDGMPDYWETANGLNASDPTDSQKLCADGYTNIEHYINSLVEGVNSADYVAPNPTAIIDLANNTQVAEGSAVTVTANAVANNGGNISKVEFYNGAEVVGTVTSAPYTYTYQDLADGTYSISVRVYDNEDNETQSTPAKLHVNSTAGAGTWTSTDIGTPEVSGSASLEEGVLTVKGAGKLGKSEGSVSGTDAANAKTDDFQYTYQKVTGDVELVTKLDYATTVDNHVFTGIMFRESLADNAKTAALGMSLVKLSSVTSWSTYLVDRKTTGGNLDEISETIDSVSSAESHGISLVTDIAFKNGSAYLGTWFKLTRHGDEFTGYTSQDGESWTKVGSTTIDMAESFYVGFAVDANKVANQLSNLSTAKFSNIDLKAVESNDVTYNLTNVEVNGAISVATNDTLTAQFEKVKGYNYPASVVLTVDGKEAAYTYDAETGILTVPNVTGAVVITAEGVAAEAVNWMPTLVDESNVTTLEADGSVMKLSNTATTGKIPQSTDTAGENTSYLLFPETEEGQILSLTMKVTNYNITGTAGKYAGAFVGAFDLSKNAFATLGFRGYDSTVGTDSLSGYWTKATGKAGNGSPKYVVGVGDEYKVTFKKNSAGYIASFENLTNPLQVTASGSIYSAEKQFKTSEMILSSSKAVQYGIALTGASVEITNMTLKDADGNVLYNQADYYKDAGTAPTVTSVAAPVISEDRSEIQVSWNGEGATGDGKYQVEVSTDQGASYTVLGKTAETTYSYTPTKSGSYQFRITGICGSTVANQMESAAVNYVLPMAEPTIDAESGNGQCKITWKAVSEATSYIVYRATERNGAYTEVGTTSGTNFTDKTVTNEVPYFYTVAAVNDSNSSNPSTAVSIMATAGHTGAYEFGEDAAKITISDKSNDTVVGQDEATFAVEIDEAGTFTVEVNGVVTDTQQVTKNQKVTETITLADGRNEVRVLFEGEDGKKTYKNLNFVQLNNVDLVVDSTYAGVDGTEVSGVPTYSTVAAAIAAVPTDNAEEKIIFVKNGRYFEKLTITTPYISIIGEDADKTVLYYNVASGSTDENGKEYGTSGSGSLIVESTAKGFTAENVTISNEFDYFNATVSAQAVAFYNKADQSMMTNVKFFGYQDTLFADGNNRQYYNKCYIEGCVDFIFGNAQAVFSDCDIVSNRNGYVTAASTEAVKNTGYVFINCRLLATDSVGDKTVYLGRPWRTNACVTYINCFMDSHIADKGYTDMSGASHKDAQFYEYGSYGPGFTVNTSRRQLSQAEAAALSTVDAVFERETTTLGYNGAWIATESYKALSTAYGYVEVVAADYTAVDVAIAKANALTAADYVDFSAVTAAINTVERDLTSVDQAKVDAMAQAIENAIAGLVQKPVEDPTEPSEDPTNPSEDPTNPSEDPTEPSEDPTEPSEEPTNPSETPTNPTETPTQGQVAADEDQATNGNPSDAALAGEVAADETKTGDRSMAGLYASLLALAVGGAVAARRKEDSEEEKQ